MKILHYKEKEHRKTRLDFKNNQECVDFFEKLYTNHAQMQQELTLVDYFNMEIKAKIKFMVKWFKKLNGTNAIVVFNSPVKVIIHGYFRF
jgi:3-oxoacyl-ACP reductase-like protein